MTELDLKRQAVKNGLAVGKKIKVHHKERVKGLVIQRIDIGTVTALYPYIFVIKMDKSGRVESFQYKNMNQLNWEGEAEICS